MNDRAAGDRVEGPPQASVSDLSAASVVLLRHGEAVSGAVDSQRPLSERGRRETERIAGWAAAAGLQVEEIRHSGKRRAAETAEIMAEALLPSGGVSAVEGLRPDDDVDPLVQDLARLDRPIMFVGHLPFLGRLAARLLREGAAPPRDLFPPSGLVVIARGGNRWTLLAAVSPSDVD